MTSTCDAASLDSYAATEHGAALASALDKAPRERGAMGDIPVDRVAARFPHEESSFGYAPGDRVVVVSRADSRTELTYDANGQVVSKSIHRGAERTTWGYAWNARGELVTVTTPNGKVWTYRYDGAGRRIEKKSPTGDTWRYVWMGAVLLHTLKNDALAETYVHEPGGTCPILRATAGGDVHFILPDQNDSPSEEVNAEGQLGWTARKGTWGEGFNAVGASGGEPFLGQRYDLESGLHYNFHRYYDPDVGRFLSTDPIDLLGGLNLYLAVSDPHTQYDRFGLSSAPYLPHGAAQDDNISKGLHFNAGDANRTELSVVVLPSGQVGFATFFLRKTLVLHRPRSLRQIRKLTQMPPGGRGCSREPTK